MLATSVRCNPIYRERQGRLNLRDVFQVPVRWPQEASNNTIGRDAFVDAV